MVGKLPLQILTGVIGIAASTTPFVLNGQNTLKGVALKYERLRQEKNYAEIWHLMHPDDQARWGNQQQYYVEKLTRLRKTAAPTTGKPKSIITTAYEHPITQQLYPDVRKVTVELKERGDDGTLVTSTRDTFYQRVNGAWVFFSTIVSKQDGERLKRLNLPSTDYRQLRKDPEQFRGQRVRYTGEVTSITENDGRGVLTLDVTGDVDALYVEYTDPTEVLRGDIATVYGVFAGTATYVGGLGYEVTLPKLMAWLIERASPTEAATFTAKQSKPPLQLSGTLTVALQGEAVVEEALPQPPEASVYSPPALPDVSQVKTVRLKNGNSLQGAVQIVDGEKVLIDMPSVGKLTFAIEEVASIDEPSVSEVTQVLADAQSPELVASKKELLSAQRRFDEELKQARQEVDFALIKSVGFNVYEELGTISGYVVFYDKDHTQCSTTGNLSISKEVTEYEKQSYKPCFTCFTQEREVPVIKERSVKTVRFHPDDFVAMKLRNGSEVYALPLKFDPDEIKKGDVVILEYRSFKEKKEIY